MLIPTAESTGPATTEALAREDLGGFDTAMAHLYRAEMHRMTLWRARLDTTSNWAVLLTTGMTTFTLGSERTPAYTMLLGLALVGMCMLFEARRYQHLHHSRWRLRLMEANYFARQLLAQQTWDDQWRRLLALDLERPRVTIGVIAAVRLRLRRNYLMIMHFITAVWLTKLFIHPQSPASLPEYFSRLAVGELFPSWFVAITAGIFVTLSTLLAATAPSEETLENWVRGEEGLAWTFGGRTRR